MLKSILTTVFICVVSLTIKAQGISGYTLSEKNEPIPFANVFIQELATGTSSDAEGKYYINLSNGVYHVIFSSVGYITQSFVITVGDKLVINKNVRLKISDLELNEVIVSAKKKDPAYEIIQKVIENKDKFLSQISSSKSKVYIKATENLDLKPKKKKATTEAQVSLEGTPMNPFEDKSTHSNPKLDNINMLEMDIILNYEYPNKYKEERIAVKSYGDKSGLYIPRFGETDFNFYRNIVDMNGLAETPVISPISRTSIVSYKYRLEKTDTINSQIVYKIKVIPRKTGNATCKGYLYINDSIWNINKLDFSFHKGGLKFYDKFRLIQDYVQINDSLWIPNRQEFQYETKLSKRKKFRGSTIILYDDFQNDYIFPSKFFGNEIAITKKEAYKKDSSYWNSSRPEPLTMEQQEMVLYRDSIHASHNSETYKDSLEAQYNKITIGELAYHGFGFRNWRKQKQHSYSPILGSVGFEVIGGFRLGPSFYYFKKWKNEKYIWTNSSFSWGLKNGDLQGAANVYFLYDPMKVASIRMRTGRSFYSINPNDAYLNQLKRSNYILNDRFSLSHRIELLNGLYLSTGFEFADRQAVDLLSSATILNDYFADEAPLQFANYQSLISHLELSYTPKQRYMTEPTRKVILGSKYPTFSIAHKKGWKGVLSSDVDFDLLEFAIQQKFTIGVLGNSEYRIQTGKFFNTKVLKIVDQKRFRQSDPYLYSNALNSFQLLDTALVATQPYVEAHYIHHFNGALINNIPLVKKLRLRVVAGAGFLYVKESNYRHEELFAGIERVFKFGKRRRLRIGVYGVAATSNQTAPKSDFKISFDIIDTWKRDWSY